MHSPKLLFVPLTAAALSLGVAHAQSVPVQLTGVVSSVAQSPPAGPFIGAQLGDAITIRLVLQLPGHPHSPHDREKYGVIPSQSWLRIDVAQDSFGATPPSNVDVWNDQLGARDWFALDNGSLAQGGHVSIDLADLTSSVFDSADLVLLRGTYAASSFTSAIGSAQVGGGLVSFVFDEFVIGNAGLGEVYCAPAIANSTGAPALMQVTGSDVLAADDLTLEARRLPANTFGFFLTSSARASVAQPGGSQGVLCLGGAIGRYQNQVQSSGASGAIALAVSPLALPQPTGAVSAQVGETWNFQAWYRDSNPVNTSNFTDAIGVEFR
jgi:hypothetical protein